MNKCCVGFHSKQDYMLLIALKIIQLCKMTTSVPVYCLNIDQVYKGTHSFFHVAMDILFSLPTFAARQPQPSLYIAEISNVQVNSLYTYPCVCIL